MSTLSYNHLMVTGPTAPLAKWERWCCINPVMIDVDDGASDAATFDEEANHNNHKGFIDFIKAETKTRVDRIRLHKLDGGLQIKLDSWSGHFGSHTHWMAENCPDLTFDIKVIDGYSVTQLIFEQGKWIKLFHAMALPEREKRWMSWVCAVGYYGSYSDCQRGRILDLESIDDDDLRTFVKKHCQDGRDDHERAQQRFHENSVRVDEIRERYRGGLVTFGREDRWGVGYTYNVTEDYDTLRPFKDHLPPGHVVPVVLEFDDPDIFIGGDCSKPACVGRCGGNWALYDSEGSCLGHFPTKQNATDEAKRRFGTSFEQAEKEPVK